MRGQEADEEGMVKDVERGGEKREGDAPQRSRVTNEESTASSPTPSIGTCTLNKDVDSCESRGWPLPSIGIGQKECWSGGTIS